MNEEPDYDAPLDDAPLRPHTYDGIREYDKRLPNWWLWTLYGSIIFSIGYWAYYHWTGHMDKGWERVQSQIEAIQLAALEHGEPPTNKQLWNFSRDANIVAAGEKTYLSQCAACHGANMEGGIGFALNDSEWVHGGSPMELFATVRDGVLEKGMPAWSSLLGQQRMAEVVAYLVNRNPTIQEPTEEADGDGGGG